MPEWIFQGTVTLSRVDFYINADTKEEAIKKAKDGAHDNWDQAGASSDDWDIDPNSGVLNE